MGDSLFKPRILERERINELLESIFETPLFYLSASMGYGKTTAVRCFLDSKKEVTSIWLPKIAVQGDIGLRWHRYCHYAGLYNKKLETQLLNRGLPQTKADNEVIIKLVSDAIDRPVVLVIDDYQEMDNERMRFFIKYLVENPIPHLHILLISRTRPHSEYIMYNMKNKCGIMWQMSLAFTKEEIIQFFKNNGFELSKERSDEVCNFTQGWVAATYLMLLEYASNQNISGINESTELIKTIIYDKMDPKYQSILMKVAPIDSFTLEQAVFIADDPLASIVINGLFKHNCFVNINAKTQEYHFHALFKYTLMEEAKKAELDIKESYNRCGQWLLERKDFVGAIEYFGRAKQYDAILDIMSQYGATAYMDYVPTLISNIFKQMPLEKKLAHPIGYLTYIHSYYAYHFSSEGRTMLNEARAYYEKQEDLPNKDQILGECTLIQVMFQNKLTNCYQYLMRAREYFKGATSMISGPHLIFTCGIPHLSTRYWMEVGTYKAIVDYMKDNMKYYIEVTDGCALGIKYLVQAEYAYEIGDLDKAYTLAHKSIYKAEIKKQQSIIISAYFVLCRIAVIKREMDQLKAYQIALSKMENERNHPKITHVVSMVKSYIELSINKIDNLPIWLTQYEVEKLFKWTPSNAWAPIVYSLLLVKKKEYIALEMVAEQALEEYEKVYFIYGQIIAHILVAIAKYNLDEIEEAKEVLTEAIELASKDQLVMIFVEFKEYIEDILKELKNKPLVTRILAFSYPQEEPDKETAKSPIAKNYELFTDREKDVVKLVVYGYKQSEIAAELHISVDTVKRHMKNIYSKLDVHTKAELIEKLEIAPRGML